MKNQNNAFDPGTLCEKAFDYVTTLSQKQLSSTAYFITHMIIGESRFYSKELSKETIQKYKELFERLENLISTHFFSFKLDIKLEFLVCARILGYTSFLENMIYSEAVNSLSPYGDYIVDTYNVTESWQKKDFNTAEHRNVLFILSTLPYRHAPISNLK